MKLFVCVSCESEFKIKELESDFKISVCPYCGEPLDNEKEDFDDE